MVSVLVDNNDIYAEITNKLHGTRGLQNSDYCSPLHQPVVWFSDTVKPVTDDHPLGPEKAVFSGRWSLVRGLHHTTIMNVTPSVPGKVVCSTRLVASHGGL